VVHIRLFGGVSAATDEGEPLPVGSMRSQTVLAVLALSPGSAVPVTRLVDLVWDDQPPASAHKALQWHVARLRASLGSQAILRVGAAYQLAVVPDAVDVARFERHLAAGDVGAALQEWTGDPLAGLTAPGLTATVDGLTERYLTAVEVDLERRLEADPQDVVGRLTELRARHPFREGLAALLMTALYRVGRQADALAVFERVRHDLDEELGVVPGPRLRELQRLVLDHDERLRSPRRVTEQDVAQPDEGNHPPGRTQDGRRGNLPWRTGRLIGRDGDVSTIADTLARSPVLTLVGPGGIGKTRLALAAAADVADRRGCGAWVVELAEISAPDDVPRAVADVLGVVEHQGRTLTQSIVTTLRSRQAVLVMDNCEHVVVGAAALVQTVAEACPTLQVIATSREGLRIRDEHRYTVEPLAAAGAGAELFSERARAVDRHFDPQVHRADIEEICRRLDGIPLAIELAAARTSSLAPSDILVRLDDPLRLLTGGHRTASERHRTLRATLQWSYDLLTPEERALLERLSVFAGPFDLAAAEAVAAGGAGAAAVTDLLGGLVERSLVVAESSPFHRRFRLLETVRQFAAEHLRAHGEADRVAADHALWCTAEIARIHGLLTGPGEIEGVARLGELWPNLRSAVDAACASGDRETAHALVGPIATEIALRGRREIGDWSERILALTPPEEADRRALWLSWTAESCIQSGDEEAGARLVQQHTELDHPLARHARAYLTKDGAALRQFLPAALAWLREQDEDDLAAFFELMSAGALLGIGCFAEVDDSVSSLADRFRRSGPPTLLHMALQTLGYSASFQGRPEAAEEYFDASTRVALPDRTLSANKPIEARAAFRRGQRGEAFGILRAYIDDLLEMDDIVAASVVAIEFIPMVTGVGRFAEGARMLRYLQQTSDFGALAARTVVAEAVAAMAEAGHSTDHSQVAPLLDDRQALEFMGAVLDDLT
jgi:predicted ATPase/DNA-binding SARP family transcriptional activator